MTRQLEPDRISKKLAFLLKDFGWNTECEFYWTTNGSHPYTDMKYRDYNDYEDYIASAPLLNEVSRWLRKKFNIDIIITRSWEYHNTYYYVIILPDYEDNKNSYINGATLAGTSYEDAWDNGIIDIIENHKDLLKNDN